MYEIQFHPAQIRKQVRYYFLSRKGFRWAAFALTVLGAVLCVGLILAPLGLQALLLTSELKMLEQQHGLQTEILQQRGQALARTERRVAEARLRQQQISIILGAPQEEVGLGGFPDHRDFDVTVPAARDLLVKSVAINTESLALLTLADELVRFAVENQQLTTVVPSICPISIGSFVLTSPFGERISPFTNSRDFHAGIDLAAREGTPVMATGNGRVVFAGRFPLSRNVRWWRYGNVVVLTHEGMYLTIYAHLDETSVRREANVKRGEQIGTVGNTGWSTSPHLHYEVRVIREGESEPVPVDPRIHILDYQWKGHESILIQGRSAPAPSFDPLPSRLKNLR